MVVLVPAGAKDLAAYAVAKAAKGGAHTVTLSAALVEKQLGPVVGWAFERFGLQCKGRSGGLVMRCCVCHSPPKSC
jgi:hypothetical protein